MEISKIQELVFSFMESVGANVTAADEKIWHASIPEAEQSFFNGDQDYRFTFDRALAEKHRDLELICEGSYLLKKIVDRLSSIPKVSRLFATTPPELSPLEPGKSPELRVITPGKVHYRQKVWFNFRVTYECDRKKEMLFSALADPALTEIHLHEGLSQIDLEQFTEEPAPGIPIEESAEDLLRLYLRACRHLETRIDTEIKDVQTWADQRYREEVEKFCAYLDEQKRELQRKKENVCFHLYFFQKEEEIEKMIRDLESEKNRKLAELREKFAVKVEITLVNAVVLAVPTLGVPAGKITKKNRESGARLAFSN